MPDTFTVVIDGHMAGKRLDVLITEHTAVHSRSHAAKLIQNQCATVDGRTKKPGYRVVAGERVSVRIPSPAPPLAEPEPIDLNILFEDDDLLAINKPPGLVVHPSPGHFSGTVVNAVLHHSPDIQAINGQLRPGIVHRLDKDTTGVLVVAKNDTAQLELSAQFAERKIEKVYKALVYGVPSQPAGTVELPIGRHPVDRKRMAVVKSAKGRPAITAWHIDESFSAAALLRLQLLTGRTHQARVHCRAFGHPIIGDPVYANRGEIKKLTPEVQRIVKTAERQMLHAWKITFKHPSRKMSMTIEAPLAEDMATLLRSLRQAGHS